MNINPRYNSNIEGNPNVDQPESYQNRVLRASSSLMRISSSNTQRSDLPVLQLEGGYMERAAASSHTRATMPQFDADFIDRATSHGPGENFTRVVRQSLGAGSSSAAHPMQSPVSDYKKIFGVLAAFSAGVDLSVLSKSTNIHWSTLFRPNGNYTESGLLFYRSLDAEEQATLDHAIQTRQQTLAHLLSM